MAGDRKRRNGTLPAVVRVEAFELSEPAVLGADVRLTIGERQTVLVGRNGAGKSAVLEGITFAVQDALRATSLQRSQKEQIPRFRCELRCDGELIGYEFEQKLRVRPDDAADASRPRAWIDWRERCWRADTDETLWTVRDARAKGPSLEPTMLQLGAGLLSIEADFPVEIGRYVEGIRSVFLNLGRVPPGVPRRDRRERIYYRSAETEAWASSASERDRIDVIALSLLRWHATDRARFDEFVSMGKRMGVWSRLDAATYRSASEDKRAPKEIALVLFDGTNIGVLADGTLRITEILHALLRPSAAILLIEEPETSIHPGLLRKLLAELEAYSTNCQVVMTTHSIQLVAAARPSDVRLVHRREGKTKIRTLTNEQLERVSEYLADDGSLGDFVFGGAADE